MTKYQKRISGLMVDRIDIHIEVPGADYEKLRSDRLGESSAADVGGERKTAVPFREVGYHLYLRRVVEVHRFMICV